MKRTRLAVEPLEAREMLAVAAGGAADSAPLLTSAQDGTVFLYGEGELPAAGASECDLTVNLRTSRTVTSDFDFLTLYVGIDAEAVATVSRAGFNPAEAGFQIADASLAEIPSITVTSLFTTNLIKNGSYAVYLYAGGSDAPVEGAWYLKAVWYDLSLSGDWTRGANTGAGLALLSLHVNFDTEQTAPSAVTVDFAAETGSAWRVSETPYLIPVQPKISSDLIARISGGNRTVQAGCAFFVSGTESRSISGTPISAWYWDYTGDGSADAEGESVWIEPRADQIGVSGIGTVSLTVADTRGNLSAPDSIRICQTEVTPALGGDVTSFAGGRAVLADLSFSDAAGTTGAFWEIDWGDGSVDEIEALANNLRVSHAYSAAASHTVAVRVTDTEGRKTSYVRL